MKGAAIALLSSVLMWCAVGAQAEPAAALLGVYLDEQHSKEYWPCADTLSIVTVWVWCQPTEQGMIGARFAVGYGGIGLTPGAVTANPGIIASQGELLGGIEVTFGECQSDWVWTHSETWVVDHPQNSFIHIAWYQGKEHPAVASCASGHPLEPCDQGPNITLCFFDGVEETSWGAIKSLYRSE